MEPDNIRFGGGVAATVLHPIVAVALILAIVLLFTLQRRYIVVPFLLISFLVPLGQVIVLGGVHLPVLRIVILCGVLRLFLLKATSTTQLLEGGFNSTDAAFIVWALYGAVAFILVYLNQAAIINRIGGLCDIAGSYFVLRAAIRDKDDLRRTMKVLAVIAGILALSMLNEQISKLNIFGLLGGHRLYPEIRDGIVRSQGVFQHEILAGVFGATLMPLFVWLWTGGRAKTWATIGIVASLVITVTSGSSTSVSAFGAALIGLCFWPLRKQMRYVRWSIIGILLILHLTMKAPVWALIGHIDFTGGSSSYHRYALVDNCIRHFGDWWLIGTKNYPDWGWDMWDLCNEYVAVALTGGLIALVCFITVISKSFGNLGRAARHSQASRATQWLLWCLGAALFSDVIGFFGVSYFDQTKISYYVLLAMIAAVSSRTLQQPVKRNRIVSKTPAAELHEVLEPTCVSKTLELKAAL